MFVCLQLIVQSWNFHIIISSSQFEGINKQLLILVMDNNDVIISVCSSVHVLYISSDWLDVFNGAEV